MKSSATARACDTAGCPASADVEVLWRQVDGDLAHSMLCLGHAMSSAAGEQPDRAERPRH